VAASADVTIALALRRLPARAWYLVIDEVCEQPDVGRFENFVRPDGQLDTLVGVAEVHVPGDGRHADPDGLRERRLGVEHRVVFGEHVAEVPCHSDALFAELDEALVRRR
jgi:hypothetical protein